MEYGNKLFAFGEPKAILGALILIALMMVAFRIRKDNKLVFFSVAWFLIALLPVSNLYPINATMAEHWLYLPSIGFFLIMAQIGSSLYRTKDFRVLTSVAIIGFVIFYSALTVRQNSYWSEPIKFYERTLKYAPDSSGVYNNLGNSYRANKENEKAMGAFKKAIAINPDYALAYYNLGILYDVMNRNEEAITAYKRVIEIKPDYTEAYNNLGKTYNLIGNKEEAIAAHKKAIKIDPGHLESYFNLGNAYDDFGKSEKAIASYKRVISINPNYVDAYVNLGGVIRKLSLGISDILPNDIINQKPTATLRRYRQTNIPFKIFIYDPYWWYGFRASKRAALTKPNFLARL